MVYSVDDEGLSDEVSDADHGGIRMGDKRVERRVWGKAETGEISRFWVADVRLIGTTGA
ncbi:MAG: hypothetical protein BWY17_04321 [Deltaproteobacteria bacterium ADurb.Bin207]|nr:MAG: hypothetical protein BWY17_04321 [Deltaproteobacteria bacterium ADurb.Bin207]